jgi:hypothetical protein
MWNDADDAEKMNGKYMTGKRREDAKEIGERRMKATEKRRY